MSQAVPTEPAPNEASKWRRFQELRDSPHYEAVVAANVAYLRAALPDAADLQPGTRWVLTCLPSTNKSSQEQRLSAISIRTMETFVLFERAGEIQGNTELHGFVNVRASTLAQGTEPLVEGLTRDPRDPGYRDAGEDQARVLGPIGALTRGLAGQRLAAAAQALAEPLVHSGSVYQRFHNRYLAEEVLEQLAASSAGVQGG